MTIADLYSGARTRRHVVVDWQGPGRYLDAVYEPGINERYSRTPLNGKALIPGARFIRHEPGERATISVLI